MPNASSLLFQPWIMLQKVISTGLSKLFWQNESYSKLQTQINLPSFFEEEENYCRYKQWQRDFKRAVKQLKETFKIGITPQIFQQHLEKLQDDMQSPVIYEMALNKLAELLNANLQYPSIYLEVIEQVRNKFRDELAADNQTVVIAFYDDLLNGLIEYSNFSNTFLSKKITERLNYYQAIIPNELYLAVNKCLSDKLAQGLNKTLVNALNRVFKIYLEKPTMPHNFSGEESRTVLNQSWTYLQQHPWQTASAVAIGLTTVIVSYGDRYALLQSIQPNALSHNLAARESFSLSLESWSSPFTQLLIPACLSYQLEGQRAYRLSAISIALTSSFISIKASAFAQDLSAPFIKVIGGGTVDEPNGGLYVEADGGTIITGCSASFGLDYEIFAAKVSHNGTLEWSRLLGDFYNNIAYTVCAASDNGTLIAGITDTADNGLDAVLIKLNISGELEWARSWGGSNTDYAETVHVTADGGIMVMGSTNSVVNSGGNDIFLTKLTSDGRLEWAKTIEGSSDWDGPASAYGTADGGTIFAGASYSYSPGADALLAKIDSNGTLEWGQVISVGGANIWGSAVRPTPDNGTVVVGHANAFGTAYDIVVIKSDQNHILEWANILRGSGIDEGNAVYVTANGDIIIGGDTDSFGAGNRDMLLAKIHGNSTLAWVRTIGGNLFDGRTTIYPALGGGIVAAGSAESFNGVGHLDILLASLTSDGDIPGCNVSSRIYPTWQSWSGASWTPIYPNISDWNNFIFRNWSITSTLITPDVFLNCMSSAYTTTYSTTDIATTATTNAFTSGALQGSTASESNFMSSSTTDNMFITTTRDGNLASFSSLSSSFSTPAGTIVGITLGSLASITLCVGGIIFYYKRREAQQKVDLPRHSFELSQTRTTVESGSIPNLSPEREEKHTIIGKKYALINKINREDAKILFEQTAIEVPFEIGQQKTKFGLGEGQFGKLRLAKNLHTNQFVGVKKIKGETEIAASKNEAMLQAQLNGKPHMMPLLDSVETKGSQGEAVLYQFMPLAGFGNGQQLQTKLALLQNEELKQKILVHVARQLLEGFAEMHTANIRHLDFKTTNFVLDHQGEVSIIDFGCAFQISDSKDELKGGSGDTRYYSPERIANARFRANNLQNITVKETTPAFSGVKVDAWALGVALFELALNMYPWDKTSFVDKINYWDSVYFSKKLQQIGELQSPAPDSLMAVIQGLLSVNPLTRLNISDALKMSVFQRNDLAFKSVEEQSFAFAMLKSLKSSTLSLSFSSAEPLSLPKTKDPNYEQISYRGRKYSLTPAESDSASATVINYGIEEIITENSDTPTPSVWQTSRSTLFKNISSAEAGVISPLNDSEINNQPEEQNMTEVEQKQNV